ncbi:MAG: hypothetical protein GX552_14865 [Chloroflexi bacterium]|jgi:hypothetical protein|nr:hypothetical protein [Chloroflexota bacterium]
MYWREVVASLYAWDLLDEGVEPILDVLERETRTNSTYLVALMHDEKRPLTDFYYPHNPRRKVYWTEDSRAYWIPTPDAYRNSRIKPRLTDNPELQGRDWLQELVVASRRRGMTVGAELSHTWIDKERAKGELADCIQQDIYGQPFGQQICFNNPDVRAYGIALYTDLAAHYDLDFIQTCVIGFHPARHNPWAGAGASEVQRLIGLTLGGCFCPRCQAAAEARGLDWGALVSRLRWIADGYNHYNHKQAFELNLLRNSDTTATALLAEIPELYAFIKFRVDSLTSFYQEIYEAVHAVRQGIDVRLNHFAQYPELMGLNLKGVAPFVDSVRSSDYAEQSGDPARMEAKRAYLHGIRRAIGVDKYFLSAISPRPKATPELVKQGILISAQCGADALTIGHYDGAWMNCLRAIKEGLDEAGIEIRRDAPVCGGGK